MEAPSVRFQRKAKAIRGQLIPILACCIIAASFTACTSKPENKYVSEKIIGGIVVADEPHAVIAAVEVLENGGSAVDSAVAAFFVMSVTYPVAVGLGAGGACVIYEKTTSASESIDFRNYPFHTDSFVGIPGAVRGLAALQARYGRLRWAQIVLPAEKLARFGHTVSRASARVTKGYSTIPGIQNFAPFVVKDEPILEGQVVVQNILADTLSRIRTRGGGDLYFGETGRLFSSQMRRFGLPVSVDQLQRYQTKWDLASHIVAGPFDVYAPKKGPSGGHIALAVLSALTKKDSYLLNDQAGRVHLIAETSGRSLLLQHSSGNLLKNGLSDISPSRHISPMVSASYPDLSPWKNAGHDGTTSVVAIDNRGQAVSCIFSMGAPFGTAIIIPSLGFAAGLASGEGEKGWLESGSDFLAPMIIVERKGGETVLVAAGTGGPAAPSSLAVVAIETVFLGRLLSEAVQKPRIFSPGKPDLVWHESSFPEDLKQALVSRGHKLEEAADLGKVNAIFCSAARVSLEACDFISDSRGFGFGFSGERR